MRYFLTGLFLLFLFSVDCLATSCVIERATPFVGITEETGNNDGKVIELFQKSTKSPKNSSYCASFVHYILELCGIKNTISAWSPTAYNKNNIVFSQGKFKKRPQSGDVFVLYSISKKRICHTGFYEDSVNTKVYSTLEANTSSSGVISGTKLDVNGDGIYRKIRSFNATYAITRWE